MTENTGQPLNDLELMRAKIGDVWPHERVMETLINAYADRHAAEERAESAEQDNKRLREALKRADQFITNGIDLGFIRMPDPGSDDPALETPEIVRSALTPRVG